MKKQIKPKSPTAFTNSYHTVASYDNTELGSVYSKEINAQKHRNTPDNLLQDKWVNVYLLTAINLKWYLDTG